MTKYIKYIPYIAIIILLLLYFNKPEIVKTETKTEIKYKTITKTIDNTKPTKIEKVFIQITDTIQVNDTIEKVVFKDLKVNKYTYVDSLANGVLESVILADKIYKRDITLKTFNKEEKTTITNYIVKSNLWIGTNINFSKGFQSQSLRLYYQHKDKFIINAGVGLDYVTKGNYWSVGIAVRF